MAYAIAPLVAPLAGASTVFIAGMVHLSNHPEDTGTPIGVIVIPAGLLGIGVPASYAVAGLIGMPIAFALRKRNRLNGYTVHGAALLLTALLDVGLVISGIGIQWFQSGSFAHPMATLWGAFAAFLMLTPFILLSTTTFWLIGVRQRRGHAAAPASRDRMAPAPRNPE